ncbi:MAG: YlxR family protein [Actinomycetes bacterium]
MTDSGELSGRQHVPQRTCCGCRQRAPRSNLVRFVGISRAGTALIVLDERARQPGRGVWLHPDQRCLEVALQRRALTRGLRLAAGAEIDAERLRSELEQVAVARASDPDGRSSSAGQSLVGSGS